MSSRSRTLLSRLMSVVGFLFVAFQVYRTSDALGYFLGFTGVYSICMLLGRPRVRQYMAATCARLREHLPQPVGSARISRARTEPHGFTARARGFLREWCVPEAYSDPRRRRVIKLVTYAGGACGMAQVMITDKPPILFMFVFSVSAFLYGAEAQEESLRYQRDTLGLPFVPLLRADEWRPLYRLIGIIAFGYAAAMLLGLATP